MTEADRKNVIHRGRALEDYGFMLALGIAALYGVGEFLIDMGLVDPPAQRRVPWVTLILFIGCVAPKTVGRATMGQVWVILAQGVARMISRRKNGNGRDTLAIEAKCGNCGNAMSACICAESSG